MLDETLGTNNRLEGSVVRGTVVGIDDDIVIVDVGLKSEGRVPLKEFGGPGQAPEVQVGDTVDVFVERFENRGGEVVLSREKAQREESWNRLERAFNDTSKCEGHIFGRVKGGFAVDLGGAVAFLPGSQVDIRPVRDIGPLINKPEPFLILKMDRRRGNIVVSRRAVLEESRAEQRNELLATLAEGQILDGVVKNITDYGAFVDLGGLDGLLHVTDISWKRVNHPQDVLGVGQNVHVQVIRFNRETQRISLGMKQLEADPWDGVELKYPVRDQVHRPRHQHHRLRRLRRAGGRRRGSGPRLRDELDQEERPPRQDRLLVAGGRGDGARGRPREAPDQPRAEAVHGQPVGAFVEQYPVGAIIEGEIRNITEFGLFVGLDHEIDGMVHLSDLDWSLSGEEAVKKYTKGDMVRAQVLDVDVEKERISLGIKQLAEDPFKEATSGIKKGDRVTCTVKEVNAGGIEVETTSGATGFIRKVELARDRDEQRPERFAPGEKIDATRDERRPDQPSPRPVGEGAGDRRREAGDGRVRLVRQRRQPRRHPGCRLPPEAGRAHQELSLRSGRTRPTAVATGRGSDFPAPFC